MKTMKKKIISMITALTVAVVLVMSSAFSASAASTTAYVGKKALGNTLTVGKEYYVAITNVETNVFFKLPSYGKVVVTANTPQNAVDYHAFSTGYSIDVPEESRGKNGFDTCPKGDLVNYNPADGSWKYFCSGSGVQDLTVYLYTDLDTTGTTVSDSDLTIKPKANIKKGSSAPTKDDFFVALNLNGELFPMDDSQWEMTDINISTDSIGRGGTVTATVAGLSVTSEIDIFCTVSYDTNGGSEMAAEDTSSTITPAVPQKAGYQFMGWYDAKTGGKKIADAGAAITPTSDMTLYAQWKALSTNAPDSAKIKVINPSSKDSSDGKITGVDSTMEYSTDNGATWTSVTGNEISNLKAGTTVLLRTKATDTSKASEAISLTIGEAAEIPQTGDNLAPMAMLLVMATACSAACVVMRKKREN